MGGNSAVFYRLSTREFPCFEERARRESKAIDHSANIRPERRSDADRRRDIVVAAACVFSERGYHAATMDEVSRRVGMSKRTVYTVFASKADIFDVLLRDWAHPFTEPIETGGRSQRAVLTETLERLVSFALEERQLAITRVLIAEGSRPGEVADAVARQGIGCGEWALQQWLRAQERLGGQPVGDPEALASTIFHAVIGEFLLGVLLRFRPRPTERELRDRIELVVGWFFAPPPTAAAACPPCPRPAPGVTELDQGGGSKA